MPSMPCNYFDLKRKNKLDPDALKSGCFLLTVDNKAISKHSGSI